MKWEFVTQFSEILILAFGLHLAIASRNANTQFRVSVHRTFFSTFSFSSFSLSLLFSQCEKKDHMRPMLKVKFSLNWNVTQPFTHSLTESPFVSASFPSPSILFSSSYSCFLSLFSSSFFFFFLFHFGLFTGTAISGCIDFSWIYCFGELLHFARNLSEFMGTGHNIFNTFSTFSIHQHTHNGSDIFAKALVSTQTGLYELFVFRSFWQTCSIRAHTITRLILNKRMNGQWIELNYFRKHLNIPFNHCFGLIGSEAGRVILYRIQINFSTHNIKSISLCIDRVLMMRHIMVVLMRVFTSAIQTLANWRYPKWVQKIYELN